MHSIVIQCVAVDEMLRSSADNFAWKRKSKFVYVVRWCLRFNYRRLIDAAKYFTPLFVVTLFYDDAYVLPGVNEFDYFAIQLQRIDRCGNYSMFGWYAKAIPRLHGTLDNISAQY